MSNYDEKSATGEISTGHSLELTDTPANVEHANDDTATQPVLTGQTVGMVIVGGLALGLVTAALMPRSRGRKIAKRSRKIVAIASELSQVLRAQAGDAASEGRDQVDKLSKTFSDMVGDHAQEAKKQGQRIAGDAADQLNDSGKAIARVLVKLIEKARR